MEFEIKVKDTRKLLEDLKKNFQCTICLELFSQPVSTKCNHIFCQYCLNEMIGTKKKEKTTRCPLCNTNVNKRATHKNEVMGDLVTSVRELCNAFEDDCQSAGVDVMPLLSQRDPFSQKKTELQRKSSLEKVKIGDRQKKISLFDFELDQSQGTSSSVQPSLHLVKKHSTHFKVSTENSKRETQQREENALKVSGTTKKKSPKIPKKKSPKIPKKKSSKKKSQSPTKKPVMQQSDTNLTTDNKQFEFEKAPTNTVNNFCKSSDIQGSTSTDDSNDYIALPNVNKIFINNTSSAIPPQEEGENTLIDESINQEAFLSTNNDITDKKDPIDEVKVYISAEVYEKKPVKQYIITEQYEDEIDKQLDLSSNKIDSPKPDTSGPKYLKDELNEPDPEVAETELEQQPETLEVRDTEIKQIDPEPCESDFENEKLEKENIADTFTCKLDHNAQEIVKTEIIKSDTKLDLKDDLINEKIASQEKIANKKPKSKDPKTPKVDSFSKHFNSKLISQKIDRQEKIANKQPKSKDPKTPKADSFSKHFNSNDDNAKDNAAIQTKKISAPLKLTTKRKLSHCLDASPFKSDIDGSLSEDSTPSTPSSADYQEKVTSLWTNYESPNRDYRLFSNPSFTHQSPFRVRMQQKKLTESFPINPNQEQTSTIKPNKEAGISKCIVTTESVEKLTLKDPQNNNICQDKEKVSNEVALYDVTVNEKMGMPEVTKALDTKYKVRSQTGESFSEDCIIPPTPPIKKARNSKGKDSIIKHNDVSVVKIENKITAQKEEFIDLEDFDNEPIEIFTNDKKNVDVDKRHSQDLKHGELERNKNKSLEKVQPKFAKEHTQEMKGITDSADIIFNVEACPTVKDTERDVIDIGSSIGVDIDLPTQTETFSNSRSNLLKEPISNNCDATTKKKTALDNITKHTDKNIYIGSSIGADFDKSQEERVNNLNELPERPQLSPLKNTSFHEKKQSDKNMYIGSSIGADFDQSQVEERNQDHHEADELDEEKFPEPSSLSPINNDRISDEKLIGSPPKDLSSQPKLFADSPLQERFLEKSSPMKLSPERIPSPPNNNFPQNSPEENPSSPNNDFSTTSKKSSNENHLKALLNSSKRKRTNRISSSSESDGETKISQPKKKTSLISYTPPQFPNESDSSDDDDTLPQVPFKKKKSNSATAESGRSSYITPGQRLREETTTHNTSISPSKMSNKSILHVSREEIEDWKTKLRSPIIDNDDGITTISTKRPVSPPFAPPIPISQSTVIRKEKVTSNKAGIPNISRLSSPLATFKKPPTPNRRKQNISYDLEESLPKVESTTKPSKPVIITTRISKKLLSQCRVISQKFGIAYRNEFDHEVTHLVVNTDENNSLSKSGYTFKYLMALVSGLWIVNYKWLFASFKAQKLVKEDPYEVKGDPEFLHQLIPNRWRVKLQKRNLKPLFHGYRFALLGRFENSPISKAQLIALLRQSKSDVIYSPSEMDCSSSQIETVVITDDIKALTKEEKVAMYNNKPNIFHPDWIVESIINCKVQDKSAHLINV